MLLSTKQVARFVFPAMFTGMLLFAACENDLNKIKEISAKLTSQPIEVTKGVEVIYSDSAKVKGKMITPLLIRHVTDSPYYVMPKGVKVLFYDNGTETGNIIADSAVQYQKVNLTKFYRNVVVTDAQGGTFKSDELIWDQDKQIIYSNKPVVAAGQDGNIIHGSKFMSDDKLLNPQVGKSTGTLMVTDSASQ